MGRGALRVRIAAAVEEDIERILEIEREAISPPWTHGALLGEVYREDSFFSVAVIDNPHWDGDVAGFVVLRRMADEGELLQIAVDKAMRRRGIADMLLGAALSYADENALKSVFLEVRKSNAAAIALYEKHGFRPLRLRKEYYSSPVEDAVVMKLR